MYEYRIKEFARVVDGDTVDLIIDLGFDILHKTRVRLHGINAPESRTRYLEEKERGLKAKERLNELLGIPFPEPDTEYVLKTRKKGKFGRYLGTIYKDTHDNHPEGPGRININTTLIEEGHAVEYFGGKR